MDMIIDTFLIAGAIAVTGAIMVVRDWKWRMACLSIIQLIGFLLVVQIWPVTLASVKLISGWIGIAIISASLSAANVFTDNQEMTSFQLFKLALIALTWVAVLVLTPQLNTWLPIPYANLFCGLVLFFCGILFFSIHTEIIEIIIGIIILLAGFDVIYSSLEGSALVTGIYAVILISISILGGYLPSRLVFRREN